MKCFHLDINNSMRERMSYFLQRLFFEPYVKVLDGIISRCWTEFFFFLATPHNEAEIFIKRTCTSMEYISHKKMVVEDREHGEK